jgi:hypothetical protein
MSRLRAKGRPVGSLANGNYPIRAGVLALTAVNETGKY